MLTDEESDAFKLADIVIESFKDKKFFNEIKDLPVPGVTEVFFPSLNTNVAGASQGKTITENGEPIVLPSDDNEDDAIPQAVREMIDAGLKTAGLPNINTLLNTVAKGTANDAKVAEADRLRDAAEIAMNQAINRERSRRARSRQYS